MLTISQLLVVMPEAGSRVTAFLEPLNDAMDEFQVNTPRRRAAFIAQVAHESGQLRYTKELASGQAYEGRIDLGNTQPGDGTRFPGRGLLQATGRGIYTRLAGVLHLDLLNQPELLEQPEPAARSAGWIWQVEKNLNGLADADAFFQITHRINGGYNGGDSRLAYWLRARRVVGLS